MYAQQLSSTAASATDGDSDTASQEPSLRALVALDEGSECNTTLYDKWYESPYSGALLTDLVDFWIFPDAELTNGQVCACLLHAARVPIYLTTVTARVPGYL